MKRFLLAGIFAALLGASSTPEYSIQAIRLANSPGDSVADMVVGAPKDEKIDTIYALWLIRGGGRNILFDSGFHRERWFKVWTIKDYLRPDEAVKARWSEPRRSHGHCHQPRSLGPHGRNRSLPQGHRLDSEGRISLLHRTRVAAWWETTAA